ncbi:hypothetical protein GLAREA_11422 [Glarea lozoyensis ATCC 20868]|uniref:Uncharacterized protein n=1 Tax=Glarea lozoyensis (strain ATCC 20868 / MF5171) TaxID=1116229 RepID=S3CYF9_GLAL2|nr:uncharacterized protein GLAREA_11422 [Glarea lozoyensis ATCC 20868]EPE24841.1 hypothetical protein GLAREA_11422 [Glarea lozoyensis ATCC 20868]
MPVSTTSNSSVSSDLTASNMEFTDDFTIKLPAELEIMLFEALIAVIGPRRVPVWPKSKGCIVPVVFHINKESREIAMKQYSRFTFDRCDDADYAGYYDTDYDSFAFFFNLSKDNLFVNLSPEGLAIYAAQCHDYYTDTICSLLPFLTMGDDLAEPYDQPDLWLRNDHLINRIQHLTLPQWALEAEFPDQWSGPDHPYDWK